MQQLKLMALDSEDLQVVSAVVQDAVLKVGEVQYLPAEKRIILAMNRFVWEELSSDDRKAGKKAFQRRKALLQFSRVNKVQASGVNPKDKDVVISILAITYTETDSPSGVIELVLAGDGAVRLEVECIEAQLVDTPAAWETHSIPAHEA